MPEHGGRTFRTEIKHFGFTDVPDAERSAGKEPTMEKYLTFDVGTTAIKTCVFDENLQMLAKCTDEYDLLTADGRVELCPETYWQTIVRAVRRIGETHSLKNIDAVCLTTQGETMIPVDKNGEPLSNAIVWLDSRAGKQAEKIRQVMEENGISLFRTTGLPEMNGFVPLAKFLWLKEEAPEIYARTEKLLLLEDYLICRLTGRTVSEKSLLTSTGWLNIRSDGYFHELLEKLDLDESKLPEACECGRIVSRLTKEAAAQLGLSADTQVVTGAMDQIAAAIGGGGLKDGVVTATIGTAMVMTSAVPEENAFSDDAMTVYRGYRKGQYVLLPFTSTAGVVFKWLKDTVFAADAAECARTGEDIYDRLCEAAADVPAGANGVTLIPYFAGSTRPRNIPDAKGVFFGLDIGSTREVLVRATLEGIGNMIRENLDMLRGLGAQIGTVQFFGGGSKNAVWNQIIADISDVTLVKPREEECGSLGCAVLAACALGERASVEDAQNCNPAVSTIAPDPSMKETYDRAYTRYQNLFDAVEGLY